MYPKMCAGVLIVLVPLAIGCNQSPVAPSQTRDALPAETAISSATPNTMPAEATMSSVTHRRAVPFSGVVTGEAVFDFATNPKGCGSTFTTITTAKGQATHMGLSTWQSQHCIGSQGEMLDAEVVLTAANGDEIFATYSGSCAAPSVLGDLVRCSAELEFSGGTGRFVNATGTAHLSATVVFEGFGDFSWPGRWAWTGTITY
jgi:hypothetical protein